MLKFFITTIFILSWQYSIGQTNSAQTINADNITREEVYATRTDGWATLIFEKAKHLANFSNQDYILHFNVNCKAKGQHPSFLIEFSDHYRDGNYGGIDFTSSESDQYDKIQFSIDKQVFGDPFKPYNEATFKVFLKKLMVSKLLTIKFYDSTENPDTGKFDLKLNRKIDFKLANPELLEEQYECIRD